MDALLQTAMTFSKDPLKRTFPKQTPLKQPNKQTNQLHLGPAVPVR